MIFFCNIQHEGNDNLSNDSLNGIKYHTGLFLLNFGISLNYKISYNMKLPQKFVVFPKQITELNIYYFRNIHLVLNYINSKI